MNRTRLFKLFKRPSGALFALFTILFVSIFLCYVHSLFLIHLDEASLPIKGAAITLVGNADPAFNTAALYLRHISLTDISTPFQDCPCCLDYFPGSYAFNPPLFFGIETHLDLRQ